MDGKQEVAEKSKAKWTNIVESMAMIVEGDADCRSHNWIGV